MAARANADGKRRGGCFRFLLKLFLLFLVLGAGAFFYLQSGDAFKRIYAPAITKASGGQVKLTGGRVSVFPKAILALAGVSVSDENGGELASVHEVELSAKTLSFIPGIGGTPHVTRVLIDSPVVTLRITPAPETPDQPEPEATPEPETDEPEAAGEFKLDLTDPMQVRIDEVKIADARITIIDEASGRTTLIAHADFSLSGMAPGKAGDGSAKFDFVFEPDDPEQTASGEYELTFTLEQPESDYVIAWEMKQKAVVRKGAPDNADSERAELRLATDISGNVGRDSTVALEIGSTATNAKDMKSGAFGLSVTSDINEQSFSSEIRIEEVNREMFNPVLALFSPARIESILIDGRITAEQKDGVLVADVEFSTTDAVLRADEESPLTPPISITMVEKARVDQKNETVEVEVATIGLIQSGRSLGGLDLSRPLNLSYGAKEEGAAAAEAEEPARLRFSVTGLSVDDVRPWADAFKIAGLETLESGRVNGTLTVDIHGTGEKIRFDGGMEIADVGLATENESLKGRTFSMKPEIRGSFTDMAAFKLDELTATISDGDRLLASTRTTAAYHLTDQTAAVDFSLEAANISELMERFGALPPAETMTLKAGDLTSSLRVDKPTTDAPWKIEGATRLAGMSFSSPARTEFTEAFDIAMGVELDSGFTRATIHDMSFRISGGPDGSSADGEVKISGAVPLTFYEEGDPAAESAEGGSAKIELLGIKTARWAELVGAIEQNRLGDVPLDGGMTVELSPTMDIRSKGQQTFTLHLTEKDQASREVVLKLEQELEKVGEKIERYMVGFTANDGGALADSVLAQGQATLGERPGFTGQVRIDALSGDFYAGLAAPAQEPAEETAPDAGGAPAPEPSPEPEPAPAPVVPPAPRESTTWPFDSDMTLSIGRITYGENLISDTIGVLHSDTEKLVVSLPRAGVNQGTVKADFSTRYLPAGSEFKWRAEGTGMQVGPVVDSAQPLMKGKLTGAASFKTEGTADDSTGNIMERANGQLNFDLTDGEIRNSGLLEYIAAVTKYLQFTTMVFNGFKGDITIKDGVSTINEVSVLGKATRLIVRGTVDSAMNLDMDVQPGVSSIVADKSIMPAEIAQYTAKVIGDGSGYVNLPVAISVRGTAAEPKYGVTGKMPGLPEAGQTIKQGITDVGGQLLRGLAEKEGK